MTTTGQFTNMTDGVRTAVDSSTDLWRRGAEQLTAGALSTLPMPDPDQAAAQYFEYLQRSLDINRQLAKKWADALSSLSDAGQSQVGSLGEAVRGHTEAIKDWLTAEIESLQEVGSARIEAVKQAGRERARQRYQDLTKAELADELGRRDLSRTGTVDELLDRLVDAESG
jgi:hypothetical protein